MRFNRRPKNEPKIECLSFVGVRERGWTPKLIAQFLGEPDRLVDNPHYRRAAPMRMYTLERVVAAEALPEFLIAKEKADKRVEVGLKVAEKKRASLCDQAEKLPIHLKPLHDDVLIDHAIWHYNDRGPHMYANGDYNERWEPASRTSDAAFLERIQVNYVRHALTVYDDALEECAAKVGVHQAVSIIRRRVYETIAEAYPRLANECYRQHIARGG